MVDLQRLVFLPTAAPERAADQQLTSTPTSASTLGHARVHTREGVSRVPPPPKVAGKFGLARAGARSRITGVQDEPRGRKTSARAPHQRCSKARSPRCVGATDGSSSVLQAREQWSP